MVTTRRSSELNIAYDNGSNGGVGLLERPTSSAPVQESAPARVQADGIEEARRRREINLQRILNYDSTIEAQPVENTVAEQVVENRSSSVSEEDIRPTSTTMQFGDDNVEIREEMRQMSANSEESTYRLNSKGKLAVILYSIAVTVILALIVLNTGVLAKLSASNTAKAETLNALSNKLTTIQNEVDSISDSDYVINIAKNDYGMVRVSGN